MPGKKKKSTASRRKKGSKVSRGKKSTATRRKSRRSRKGRKKCPEHGRNRNYKNTVVCRKNKRRSAIPREQPCKNGVVKGAPGAPCLQHPRKVTLKAQHRKRKSTAAKRK